MYTSYDLFLTDFLAYGIGKHDCDNYVFMNEFNEFGIMDWDYNRQISVITCKGCKGGIWLDEFI